MRFFFSLFAFFCFATPAAADQLLATYQTFLSTKDHYNSNGTRLTSAAAVIAQDRANLHRYGNADNGDEWDSFFTTTGRRQLVDGMLNRAGVSASTRNAIVNREVYIAVEIYSGVGTGPYMTVWMR